MELLILYFIFLLAIWMFASITLALIWFLKIASEDMQTERAVYRLEREKLIQERMQLLDNTAMERRDLYDRIQAGTLPQYKEHVDDPNNSLEEDEDEVVVDLESAKNEIMGKQTDG